MLFDLWDQVSFSFSQVSFSFSYVRRVFFESQSLWILEVLKESK